MLVQIGPALRSFVGATGAPPDIAGVFRLNRVWPDLGDGGVGFRCTKSL